MAPHFWKMITSDNILIFQTDAILIKSGIDEFLDYSYVVCGYYTEKKTNSKHEEIKTTINK